MRKVIDTPNAPSSPLYSQAVKAGQHVYVSGLVGIDVSTGNLAGSTIQEQTRQALTNCQAVLQAAGATLADVVEVGVLLTNASDFAGMNDEYATWFPAEPADSLRRQARCRDPRSPRFDPHDRVRRLADGVRVRGRSSGRQGPREPVAARKSSSTVSRLERRVVRS
jgi:2-iminobutanoate/2-iminopropanoate deaminase